MHIHETRIDGKRFLDEIKACSCQKKTGGEYELLCRIHQRGETWYQCPESAGLLSRDDGRKTWYLTPEAQKTAREAIRRFEDAVARTENEKAIRVRLPEEEVGVALRRRSKTAFNAVLRFPDGQGIPTVRLLENKTVGEIVKETAGVLRRDMEKKETADLLERPTRRELPENPFYRAALASGDELLPVQLRLLYRLADKDDCKKLGKLLRRRVLPALGKEYDRVFTIPAREIDFNLLLRSGYEFVHRPYFAMRDSTHSLCEINPHTKYGVDAGKDNAEPTSFRAFLALFEEDGSDTPG